MTSLERIRENSREINRLLARINALVQQRDASPAQRAEWRAACEEFYARYDGLCFPGGAAMLERVRSGDARAVEAAVQFLLADPYHFRSGYLKARLWRWLARQPLGASARNRLERAALAYLDRRICREFWAMAKAMPRIGRAGFWGEVAARTLPGAGAACAGASCAGADCAGADCAGASCAGAGRDVGGGPGCAVARRATLLLAHGASVHAGARVRVAHDP